jgi:hypothetical protein
LGDLAFDLGAAAFSNLPAACPAPGPATRPVAQLNKMNYKFDDIIRIHTSEWMMPLCYPHFLRTRREFGNRRNK